MFSVIYVTTAIMQSELSSPLSETEETPELFIPLITSSNSSVHLIQSCHIEL